MSTFLKLFVALALTLPVGAYVAGTLVASQSEAPARRIPIVLTDVEPPRGPDGPSASPTSGPTTPRPGASESQDADDGPVAINPTPHEVGEEHEDRADDREDRADDREDRAEERPD